MSIARPIVGGALALSSTAVLAQLTTNGEWPMAAASIMLTAIGSHNEAMLEKVNAPGALYFATYDDQEKGRSTPLSLDSFANLKGHCNVSSVRPCGGEVASIEWSCSIPHSKKPVDVWSDVRVDAAGKINRVVGNGPPLVCVQSTPVQQGGK